VTDGDRGRASRDIGRGVALGTIQTEIGDASDALTPAVLLVGTIRMPSC
jgi:hypothetical protein